MIHSHPNYILLNIIPTHPATSGIRRSGYNSLHIAMEMNWLFYSYRTKCFRLQAIPSALHTSTTHGQLRITTCMLVLNCGRKLDYPEETHGNSHRKVAIHTEPYTTTAPPYQVCQPGRLLMPRPWMLPLKQCFLGIIDV